LELNRHFLQIVSKNKNMRQNTCSNELQTSPNSISLLYYLSQQKAAALSGRIVLHEKLHSGAFQMSTKTRFISPARVKNVSLFASVWHQEAQKSIGMALKVR
jgi:hypothetical protein